MSRFQDLKNEKLKRRYRDGIDGFTAFCYDQIKIRHPEKGLIRFELRDPQIETVQAYRDEKQVIILKARQIGFTTVTMVYSMWEALFRDYYSFAILSRREIDAVAALSMVDTAWENMNPTFRASLPKRTDDNQKWIHWDNGSLMESHQSSNNPIRSRTFSRVVLDEYGFQPDPEEGWASVEPTFDVGGQVILLSTANGMGNVYHDKWVGAYENHDNGFHPIFFPWSALPERDEAWYAEKKRSLKEWQLHQEYPTTPEEAFIKSGNPVFDTEKLSLIRTRKPVACEVTGPEGQWRGVKVTPHTDGQFSVYEWPVPYVSYVVGVDVAEGLDYGDFSSVHVVRTDTGEVVAHWHGHIDPDLYGLLTCRIAAFYNMALLGTEINNHGHTTVSTQKRLAYPRIFSRVKLASKYGDPATEQVGFFTSVTTKPRIIDELHAAIRDDVIQLWDRPTIAEMMRYVRKEDGKTEGSPFDDRVMSLAIAWMLLPHAYSPAEDTTPENEEMTMAWWSAEGLKQAKPQRVPIGAHNTRQGKTLAPTGTGFLVGR